jgi:hypothetical protein
VNVAAAGRPAPRPVLVLPAQASYSARTAAPAPAIEDLVDQLGIKLWRHVERGIGRKLPLLQGLGIERVEPVDGIGQHLRQLVVARRGQFELADEAVVRPVARGERAVDRAAGEFAVQPGNRHHHVGRAEFVEHQAPPVAAAPGQLPFGQQQRSAPPPLGRT